MLLKRPVSKLGSILLAELVAVLMFLEHIIQHTDFTQARYIQILSDSQTTVGIITQGWNSNSYKGLIQEIKSALKILASRSLTVELLWTPGHTGLQENEKADQLAKGGAEEARCMPEETRIITIQEFNEASYTTNLSRWQKDRRTSQLELPRVLPVSHSATAL